MSGRAESGVLVSASMDDLEMHWETSFRHHARRQGGTLGIHQLAAMGCNGDHWRRAHRSGRWARLSPRVLVLQGTPPSDDLRAHAAVLDAGPTGMLHGPSTLAWCGLRGFDLAEVHVLRRRGTTTDACDLAVVHRVRDLRDEDVCCIRGVPTISPLRAIWSEASRYSDPRSFEPGLHRIGRLLDDAHGKKLLTWSDLHRAVDQLGRRGRAGTVLMRAAAAQRPPGSSPTESRNEDRLEEVLADAGSEPLRRQPLVGGHRPIGRTDFRDPGLPLVVEVNSLQFHSAPSDVASDRARYDALLSAGFTLVVVWEDALWSNTGSVVDAVRRGRSEARRGQAVEIHTVGCPWPHDARRIVVGRSTRQYRG